MAETFISKLPIEGRFGDGSLLGPRAKVAVSWFRAFGLLAIIIVAGATIFRDAVATSIASTPHPELVYTIFAVAIVASILLAILLHDFIKEQAWFDSLRSLSVEDQDRMIATLPRTASMAYFYRVFMQTRGMPLATRQPAMEDEMSSAESQMFTRLSLPNLLSGSLVGLGLVGTFIGLLQTLDELSGVFAALGGGSGNDSGAMFSTMIVKLQGPMQGMGTAFVASLYGLLGSLVIGLTVSSVKSAGERLFRDVREFVNEELYPAGGATMAARSAASADAAPRGAFSPAQSAELHAMISQEHKAMRDLFIHWEQSFSRRFDQLANVASHINHQLVDTVNTVGAQAERNTRQLKLVSEAEGRLASAIDDKGGRFVDQIDSLRKDLSVAQHGVFPVFGRLALAFAVIGALAGLAAIALSLGSGRADTAPKQAAPAAVTVVAPKPAPATVVAPAAELATKAPSNADTAPEQVIVAEGDSLSKIALDRNITLGAMIAANPQLTDPMRLYPGDKINLPKATASPEQ